MNKVVFIMEVSYNKGSSNLNLFSNKRTYIIVVVGEKIKKTGGKKVRKKIEELRNREEGFTLVELLAVIVILGIIVAIAIPAIGGVIETAKDDAAEQEVALVEDAARLYFTTSDNAAKTSVTVEVLKDDGYLEKADDLNDAAKVEKDSTTGKVKLADTPALKITP